MWKRGWVIVAKDKKAGGIKRSASAPTIGSARGDNVTGTRRSRAGGIRGSDQNAQMDALAAREAYTSEVVTNIGNDVTALMMNNYLYLEDSSKQIIKQVDRVFKLKGDEFQDYPRETLDSLKNALNIIQASETDDYAKQDVQQVLTAIDNVNDKALINPKGPKPDKYTKEVVGKVSNEVRGLMMNNYQRPEGIQTARIVNRINDLQGKLESNPRQAIRGLKNALNKLSASEKSDYGKHDVDTVIKVLDTVDLQRIKTPETPKAGQPAKDSLTSSRANQADTIQKDSDATVKASQDQKTDQGLTIDTPSN